MFGLHPWDWDRLTADEVDSAIEYIENRNAEMRKASSS